MKEHFNLLHLPSFHVLLLYFLLVCPFVSLPPPHLVTSTSFVILRSHLFRNHFHGDHCEVMLLWFNNRFFVTVSSLSRPLLQTRNSVSLCRHCMFSFCANVYCTNGQKTHSSTFGCGGSVKVSVCVRVCVHMHT